MSWIAPHSVEAAHRTISRHVRDGIGECEGCRDMYGVTARHPCSYRVIALEVIEVATRDEGVDSEQ